jgi:truncated hemoglobin YjbI
MAAAVRAGGLEPEAEREVLAYFERAANHLVNRP